MSQADSANSTTRIQFASAGAVRARARHAAVLPATQLAHNALIGLLAQETPHNILYAADRFDILERADHLKTIFAAVTTYTKAIIADTKQLAVVGIDADTGALEDAASDIVGALNNAVDRMIDQAAE